MKKESLIGRRSIDVVLALPHFDWSFKEGWRKEVYPEIATLFFVNYEIKKHMEPRTMDDLFQPIKTSELSLGKLKDLNLISNSNYTGLTSRVFLGKPFEKIGYGLPISEYKVGHIPMVDLDTNEISNLMQEQELLDLINTKIKDLGLMGGGLLLTSSKENYHFIGTGELLCKEDFINFCGDCLTKLRHKTQEGKIIRLVDPEHIGHSLNPMKYLEYSDSLHDSSRRFSTLRITPKNNEEDFPKVVEVIK